ncbi:MAG TPA: hypothetical protein VKE98_20755 [Gemmataceae bacterium]|nr:hypothetical protein [Gemmataceae bacterium]
MNEKIEHALMLIEQMIDQGDCPIGLFEVRRLLASTDLEQRGEPEYCGGCGDCPYCLED